MKVTSVEIHPDSGAAPCVLSYRDPKRLNTYNVKTIVGLDADEITPHFYGSVGKTYYDQILPKKELVIRIELNPRFNMGESYSSLRDTLYRMISSSRTGLVKVQFKDVSIATVQLAGQITKFEASLNSPSPEVQLTIKCVDPMIKAIAPTYVNVSGLDPASTTLVDAESTAPHGFKFVMDVLAPISQFSITGPSPNPWSFTVIPTSNFLAGDVLYFSSEYNNKYIIRKRGTTSTHIADRITANSIWPTMFPVVNNVLVFGTPASLQWSLLLYTKTYWGI